METLLKDIRYGVRSLRQRPGFTVVAVITLALGIGLNTAIFSVINAVLLRPLGYPAPERLIALRPNQSCPDLLDLQAQTRTLSKVGGLVVDPLDYTAGIEPIQFQIGEVTGDFFAVLGVSAKLGRTLGPEDDKNGAARALVLSYSLWQKQFGGDARIIGKPIPLSGNPYPVVGVMPADFRAPGDNTEAWVAVHVANPLAANFR